MFYDLLRPYITQSSKIKLKRGDAVYNEGDFPNHLYLIDSGLVGLFHLSETGKETFLRVFGEGDIFGHRSYFAQTPYHATSIALANTEASIITNEQCNHICKSQPELLKEMTKLISQSLGDAELRLAGLLDKSASARIVEALIFFKLKYPVQIWTRKEIAEFSGSSFETVTRVMTILSNNKLIKKDGRDFEILDTQDLLTFSKTEL